MRFLPYRMLYAIAVLFFVSCSQTEVTFYVTRSSELPVENIKFIAIGKFTDELGRVIPLPGQLTQKPKEDEGIGQFVSNQKNGDLVRSFLISEISKGGEYRIINASGGEESYSGIVPDAAAVGVINARVKYYEFAKEDNDKRFYVLLITNNGAIKQMSIPEQLGIAVLKEGVVRSAEKSGKGFEIAIPYVEKVAALEVKFDFVRSSNGQKIVPTQTFRRYYTNKWGGEENKSILPKELRKIILEHYGVKEKSLWQLIDETAIATLWQNEEEHTDDGNLTQQESRVPFLSLDLRQKLAQKVVTAYVKKISRYHDKTSLSVASGDAIGVTLIRGNAYDKAIGHLESLPKPLSANDTYNLAVAYESMGEYAQALKYYEEGFQNTKEQKFRHGINRVKR